MATAERVFPSRTIGIFTGIPRYRIGSRSLVSTSTGWTGLPRCCGLALRDANLDLFRNSLAHSDATRCHGHNSTDAGGYSDHAVLPSVTSRNEKKHQRCILLRRLGGRLHIGCNGARHGRSGFRPCRIFKRALGSAFRAGHNAVRVRKAPGPARPPWRQTGAGSRPAS